MQQTFLLSRSAEHLAGRLGGSLSSRRRCVRAGWARQPTQRGSLKVAAISNTRAPLTAWSPLRSFKSLSKFFATSGAAMATAWFAHPHLRTLAAQFLHLDYKDSVTAFQTSFFSFLSLVFAIYSGNTMAFLYDRQKELVKNLYAECMALEELLEEVVQTLGPDARDILAQIRVYIDTEIYCPENQSPPLGEGLPLSAIRSKARNYRRAGTDVGDILQASQQLAHAQSSRQATACRLLPPVHWALLYSIGSLFVVTFILFETGTGFSDEGRHILFTILCGLMAFVLCALRDLADPAEGVYNATALLDERLSYVRNMLDKFQKLPARPAEAATVPAVDEDPAVAMDGSAAKGPVMAALLGNKQPTAGGLPISKVQTSSTDSIDQDPPMPNQPSGKDSGNSEDTKPEKAVDAGKQPAGAMAIAEPLLSNVASSVVNFFDRSAIDAARSSRAAVPMSVTTALEAREGRSMASASSAPQRQGTIRMRRRPASPPRRRPANMASIEAQAAALAKNRNIAYRWTDNGIKRLSLKWDSKYSPR